MLVARVRSVNRRTEIGFADFVTEIKKLREQGRVFHSSGEAARGLTKEGNRTQKLRKEVIIHASVD